MSKIDNCLPLFIEEAWKIINKRLERGELAFQNYL